MNGYSYFDFLSAFGVSGAHPGGFLLTKDLLSKEKISSESFVLDAGCGTGQTAAFLSEQYGANVYALEINPTMVKKAQERFKVLNLPVRLFQGSIEDIPFDNHSFDFLLSESVLAFVNKKKSLSEIFRVLKKGGRMIAIEMTMNFLIPEQDENEIKQFYGLDSLLLESDWRNLLEETGFDHIEISSSYPTIQSPNTNPEFHFSKNFDLKLFDILHQHAQIIIKHQDSLSYRIITCEKP
jgi:ubiquinone/menaquinone biosynthesis C-methylase UbiE